MFDELVRFIRDQYRTSDAIPLHAPTFIGNEATYVIDTVRSSFVSSVGAFVDRFERDVAAYTGAARATAVVNGTAAIHIALLLAGVRAGDLVATQPLTFVASCNAIAYCGADPIFIDVDRSTLGLSPAALDDWLEANAFFGSDGSCRTRNGDRRISACLPMHTFGHPVDLQGLLAVGEKWGIAVVEDAAEAVGSLYKGRHVGTLGTLGALSFNGNKIITTGGGGMILSNEPTGARAKHLTTTAKAPHPYEFVHDAIGYNYRLPNINASLGCAQLERLADFVEAKRALARRYAAFLSGGPLLFVEEPPACRSNYWLNAVICGDRAERDALLKATNEQGVMTRPVWRLMNRLPMYSSCLRGPLNNAEWLEDRIVNLPSSVPPVSAVNATPSTGFTPSTMRDV